MCNCITNPCGCDSGIALPYLTGTAGEDGLFGGYSAEWKFDTSVLASPAAGYTRFNSATPASVTEIYVSDFNIDSIGHDAFLDSFSNSSVYGTVKIWKQHNSNIFWMGNVTGVTDNGSDHTLAVTHIQSNETFAADDNVVISFTAKGATGNDGADGADGLGSGGVVDTVFDDATAASTAAGNLVELSLAADTMSTDEDILEFSIVMNRPTNGTFDYFNISFGDQGYAGDSNEEFCTFDIKDTSRYVHMNGVIHRKSSTEARCETKYWSRTTSPGSGNTALGGTQYSAIGDHTVTIDWSDINLLQINNTATTTGIINIESFSMKYTKKIS